jgi:hypothetical protein
MVADRGQYCSARECKLTSCACQDRNLGTETGRSLSFCEPPGGWPAFSKAFACTISRRCPILAFFARVGGDAASGMVRHVGVVSTHVRDFPTPAPSQRTRRNGAPAALLIGREVKSPGHRPTQRTAGGSHVSPSRAYHYAGHLLAAGAVRAASRLRPPRFISATYPSR